MKGRGRITQSEGHHFEFIVSMVRAKASFTNILFMHTNMMIALKKVQFREPTGATKFIQKFINGGNRKAILDGNGF